MPDPTVASPLKAALAAAGLTTEQFADILQVDAKTVRRWLHGRIPYPRHRIAISQALDLPQARLWPELPDSATHPQTGSEPSANTDPVTGYPGPDHPDLPLLADLIDAATGQIDIADDTLVPPPPGSDPRLSFPSTQLADHTLLTLLADKARGGVRIRLLVGRVERDLAPLLDLPGIQLRAGGPHHTIHRADDHLLLGLAAVTPAIEPRPVLHVQRRAAGGLFDRLLQSYEIEWDDADPITTSAQLDRLADEIEAEREEDLRELEDHADNLEPDALEENAGPPPRRWPRRPQ